MASVKAVVAAATVFKKQNNSLICIGRLGTTEVGINPDHHPEFTTREDGVVRYVRREQAGRILQRHFAAE